MAALAGWRPKQDAESYVSGHTSHTYRRPREGLARMAARRAGQGRSRRCLGGVQLLVKGRWTLSPKGRCSTSHRLHLIPAAAQSNRALQSQNNANVSKYVYIIFKMIQTTKAPGRWVLLDILIRNGDIKHIRGQ